jgi:cephalosporin-C deacetylase
MMMTHTNILVLMVVMLLGIALVSARAGEPLPLRNAWIQDGGQLTYASDELGIRARLPYGFESLQVKGCEFLQGGNGYGGMAFRKPDGSYITRFTDISNVTHDQSRRGIVTDGLYMVQITTGYTLPDFELYAGFNDPNPHDLVLFMSDGVCALRAARRGDAIMNARQNVLRGAKPGAGFKTKEVAVVHDSGMVLHITAPDQLMLDVITAPDGQPRLAIVIPCKGMAANAISCRVETHNGSDALMVFPTMRVTSSTMGQDDPGYKPQSNGYWALYAKDAQVDYLMEFGWLGSKPFPGVFRLDARHALGQPHFRLDAQPEKLSAANGVTQYRATIHPRFRLPGVSECNAFLLDDAGVILYADRLRFLYDWSAYQPTYNTPPDMKAFWDSTLAALAKVPLEPKIEETLFKDDTEWEFQHVSYAGWNGQRIHALLYIPKAADKPLPVVITAHPGTLGFGVNHRPDGVYGSKVKADPRFVTIVPLIRGHLPDAKDVPFNQPWWGPLDSRETHAARSWFTSMVRALDYLATRPDLADMTRVVSSGGSQGGALALATAALDKRVSLCIADSPSNCMLNDSVRPGTYGTFGPTAGQVPPGQTLDDLLRTLSYFDPANMAPWITCPTVIHLTVGDLTVHSMGGLGVYKNLTGLPDGKKWFFPGVNGHYHAGSAAGGAKAKELMERLVERKPLVE